MKSLRERLVYHARRLPFYAAIHRTAHFLSGAFRRIELNILRAAFSGSRCRGLPTGAFSALESLNRGELSGRIILKGQGNPSIPVPSVMELSNLKQHLEQPWPIFWTLHQEARLVGPSLGLVNERKELCIESCFGTRRIRSDPAWNTLIFRKPIRLKGNYTSIISKWTPANALTNYSHWLLEALPRLALLEEFPPETAILVPAELQPFQKDTLKWLGLEDRVRPCPESHFEVENYYFSVPPAMIVCYNPYAVEFCRRKLLPFGAPRAHSSKRIFNCRSQALFRQLRNEAEVIAFFQRRGWSIVNSGELPLALQISLFAEAEAICGLHGAGFANTIWCGAGCKIIELFSEHFLSGCYEWLAQCVGAEHHFLIFESDHAMNIQVDLAKLERLLEKIGM